MRGLIVRSRHLLADLQRRHLCRGHAGRRRGHERRRGDLNHGSPLLAALLLCYTGAVVSAFASSTALLGAVIPLAMPFLLQGRVSAIGVIAAIAICTTIVDTSPFSTNGALVVANAPEADREKVLRLLLIYSGFIVVLGPIIAWLVLVAPDWL